MIRRWLKQIEKGVPFQQREFWPLDWDQRRFIVGNFKAFGWRHGLRGNLTLMSPLINLILNYQYRHKYLIAHPLTGELIVKDDWNKR